MNKLLLIFFVVLLTFTQKSYALEIPISITPTPQIFNVEYELPYPGILPDNPLYFLKVIRDNLIGFFKSDPAKKADYDLLMADKRLVSAKALIEKGKTDLGITTLSKAGNYFDQALQLSASAKRKGQNVDPIISRLVVASKKHQELIYQMVQKTKGQVRYNLELLQIRARSFQETAELLKSS